MSFPIQSAFVTLLCFTSLSLSANQLTKRPWRCDPVPSRIEGVQTRYRPVVKGTAGDEQRTLQSLSALSDEALDRLFKGTKPVEVLYSGKIVGLPEGHMGRFDATKALLELLPRDTRREPVTAQTGTISVTGAPIFTTRFRSITEDALPALWVAALRSKLGGKFEQELKDTFKTAVTDKKDLQGLSGKAVNLAAIKDQETYLLAAAGSYFCSTFSRALMKTCFPRTYAFVDKHLASSVALDPKAMLFGDMFLPLPEGETCIDQEKLDAQLPLPEGPLPPMILPLPADGEEKVEKPAGKVDGSPIRIEPGFYVDAKRAYKFKIVEVLPEKGTRTETVVFETGEKYTCDTSSVCEDALNRITIIGKQTYHYHLRDKSGQITDQRIKFERLKD